MGQVVTSMCQSVVVDYNKLTFLELNVQMYSLGPVCATTSRYQKESDAGASRKLSEPTGVGHSSEI